MIFHAKVGKGDINDDNSPKRYRNTLRHELELNWIKILLIGFNGCIYHEGTITRFT